MISYMKESHGDWFGVAHNSATANDLKKNMVFPEFLASWFVRRMEPWSRKMEELESPAWPQLRLLPSGRNRQICSLLWLHTLLYFTAQYYIVLYCIVLYSLILYCTLLYLNLQCIR